MTNFTVKFKHAACNVHNLPTLCRSLECGTSDVSVRTNSETHVKGTKDDDIEETGEPAERLLDPIFKVGANNKPQCSFKLEVKFDILIGQ